MQPCRQVKRHYMPALFLEKVFWVVDLAYHLGYLVVNTC
jgi:hypothetical protein